MWTLKEMDLEVEGFVAGLALVVLLLVGAFIPQVPGGDGATTRPFAHAPLTMQLDMPAITAHPLSMAFQHRDRVRT